MLGLAVVLIVSPTRISRDLHCQLYHEYWYCVGHHYQPLQALWVCLSSVWVQVKLQWDEDDEACGVCGDDEQAEGYITPHALFLGSSLCCCIIFFHSCSLFSSA